MGLLTEGHGLVFWRVGYQNTSSPLQSSGILRDSCVHKHLTCACCGHKPAYLTSGLTGPKDHLSRGIQMFRESDWYFCYSTELLLCKSPRGVHLHVYVLNTTAHFGPSFAHFFSVALRLCCARCCPFAASAGIARLPSVSLCAAGARPAVWLCVESCFLSSWLSPREELPPKHVEAHAAFSSTAKLFLSKSRDQGPQKEPTSFSLRSLSILPTGKCLCAWKFHSNYSQV